jgi:hypothetical protein
MAITFETARTIATVASIGFGVLAIGSAILLKSMTQKLAMLAIFGLIGLLVWTQRSALDTCYDLVRAGGLSSASVGCEFFGQRVSFG